MPEGRAKAGDGSRNDHFVARRSRKFASCREAEAYINSTGYWSEPVVITDTAEADKFQREHPIRDAAQDGKIAYKK